MPAKKIFQKRYIDFVRDVALANGKVSNRMIAKRLGVDDKTIAKWRKEHPDFDRPFTDAVGMAREVVTGAAFGNLKVRKMKIVKETPDGKSVTTQDVLPTHNDVAVFSKIGLPSVIVAEQQQKNAHLRDILDRKNAGEITALQAAQYLEIEGVPVPATLLLEIKQNPIKADEGEIDDSTGFEHLTFEEIQELLKNE